MARGNAARAVASGAYVPSGPAVIPSSRWPVGPSWTRRMSSKFYEASTCPPALAVGPARAGAADVAIDVHKTDLFRKDECSSALRARRAPAPARASSRPLHLWSAGCATGEEVATLLILMAEAGRPRARTVLGRTSRMTALRQARRPGLPPVRAFSASGQSSATLLLNGAARGSSSPMRERALFALPQLMEFALPGVPRGPGLRPSSS